MSQPVTSLRDRILIRAFSLDTRSLAVFRIGLGLLLVADALLRGPDVPIMLGPDGIFPLDALRQYHGTATLWSLAFIHDSTAWSAAIVALQGMAGVALAFGWHSRLATMVGWVALVSVIRRGSPAVNSGDVWLACQLFWSMFLPLGERWSWDAARRRASGSTTPAATSALSVATVALVFQLVAVYLGAGLSKCNAEWFTGDALTHALSVHDHGTSLGMALTASYPWLMKPMQWTVLALEVALPVVLVAVPVPRVRIGLVFLCTSFHLASWLGMDLGLFPAVGIVAWIPLLPREFWSTATADDFPRVATLGWLPTSVCATAAAIAAAAFLLRLAPWRWPYLPAPITMAVNITALHQEWQMFGDVPARAQWVYGRAVLADGTEVDILRDGCPLEAVQPNGGFTSLPNYRWHSFFWHLYDPEARCFAEPAARALAMNWNRNHPAGRKIVSLEIRYGFLPSGPDGTVRDVLVASWPARSAAGAGNLERFLREADREEQ